MKKQICEICGAKEAVEKTITEKFEYKGEAVEVPDYHITYCENCGESIVHSESIKKSEPAVRDLHWKMDGFEKMSLEHYNCPKCKEELPA